jgi:hypothetical protein
MYGKFSTAQAQSAFFLEKDADDMGAALDLLHEKAVKSFRRIHLR